MDVTSMLNQSAAAPGHCEISTRGTTPSSCLLTQEKLSSASLPTPSPDRTTPQQDWDSNSFQGRKPWSAGGYALPSRNDLKFRSNSIFSVRSASDNPDSESSYELTATERDRYSRMGSVDSASIDLEASQPCIPATRTLQNQISSVTTLSGIHSTRQSVAELPLLETTLSSCSESYSTLSSAKRSQQPINTRPLKSFQNDEMTAPKRSGSPSDAVLNMNNSNKPQIVDASASELPNRSRHSAISTRLHKRAISAPNFSPAANYKSSRQLRPVLAAPIEVMVAPEDENVQSVTRNSIADEGVPDRAEHQGEGVPPPRSICTPPSPAVTASLPDYGTGPADPSSNTTTPLDEDDEEKPVCMFVDDCDTGSQLRKAISHLFGRNKTCTLKIPKMVWVYYCRKHYQRVRYRNARTYPVTQMELVETQIERLKAWSDENQARGKGAYIKSWTLSLRKREEKRLKGNKGNKGNKGANEEVDDVSAAPGASYIPSWIIDELGGGFDTGHVFGIAARLREEIESGILNQVPEIEFLPDIVDDEGENDEIKPVRHRRQTGSISTAKQPKRKAFDFSVVAEQNPIHEHGDMNHQTRQLDDESMKTSPSGKRPRRTVGDAKFSHLQHQESVGLHGTRMGEPPDPYMATCYGFAAQGQAGHPPRAQNIVPKMEPLDFTHRHAYSAMNRPLHQGSSTGTDTTTPGHARMSSYQEPRELSNHHNHYSRHYAAPADSGGHGHQWDQHTIGRRKSTSPPTLPSISTQMMLGHGGGPPRGHLQSGRGVASMRPQSRQPPRPMHQRSASAYTPRCRFGSVPGRLSMTGGGGGGGGGPVEQASYNGDNCRPPSPTFHDPVRHGFPAFGRPEWAPNYGQAPQYAQHQYESNHMPPPMVRDASHQEPSITRHNASAHPEPVGPMSRRCT
ncbi:hypothetical protein E4U53_001288 [Claviceps sorghi]|nr:hypothetical protein E4U53_001288 [Claviceps sorghi]